MLIIAVDLIGLLTLTRDFWSATLKHRSTGNLDFLSFLCATVFQHSVLETHRKSVSRTSNASLIPENMKKRLKLFFRLVAFKFKLPMEENQTDKRYGYFLQHSASPRQTL